MSLRKKHTDGQVYEVFPMEVQRASLGENTVYDRETRGKSWIILDLWTRNVFIPRGSTGLITADGKHFLQKGRNYAKGV